MTRATCAPMGFEEQQREPAKFQQNITAGPPGGLWQDAALGNSAAPARAAPPVTSIAHRLDQLLARFATKVRLQIARNRLIQHGIDADDVEQEVRIRLWRALERDPNAEFRASYIQKVVATVLVDALRRQQARPAEALPEPEESGIEFSDGGARPDRVAMDAEQMAKLAQGLQELLPRRRRSLQLYLQGYALQEVADLNGLTPDAARKLICRGLEDLKKRLAALGLKEYENDDQ